jgi:hypothetical protein
MKARIQVSPTLARGIAQYQLDRAIAGERALVSDRCVFEEVLMLAKVRGVELEFFTSGDCGLTGVDLAGAWAVIEGRER